MGRRGQPFLDPRGQNVLGGGEGSPEVLVKHFGDGGLNLFPLAGDRTVHPEEPVIQVPHPQEEAVLGEGVPPPRNTGFIALCEASQFLFKSMKPRAVDSGAEQRGTSDYVETTSLHIVSQVLQLVKTLRREAETR